MLDFISNSLKKIFGTKYDRDEATYMPIVDKVNEYFAEYESISHDELRQKSFEFKQRIKEHLTGIDDDINRITKEAASTEDINYKESLFKELDDLKTERDKHLEDILKEILPEAFAVVKETARRFSENSVLEVTATEHDRDLAARPGKTYVSISGDKAHWKNQWIAAGGEIIWFTTTYS